MFGTALNGLPPISEVVSETGDMVFGNVNINAAQHIPDDTFLATARILCSERLRQCNHNLNLHYREFSALPRNASAEEICARFFTPYLGALQSVILLTVHDSVPPETADRIFGKVRSDALAFMNGNLSAGLTELADLSAYMKQYDMDAVFFYSSSAQNMIVFIRQVTLANWHALQSILPRLVPWLFDGATLENGEFELLRACGRKSARAYRRALEALVQRVDLREASIRRKLSGIRRSQTEAQLSAVSDGIKTLQRRLDVLRQQYDAEIAALNEQRIRLAGLKSILESGHSGDDELADYFIANKHLNLMSASDGQISFIVKTRFDVFDPEVFEIYMANESSFYYEHVHSSDHKRLLLAIFEEGLLRVRSVAPYNLALSGSMPRRAYLPETYDDYMPNPHIVQYNCLGQYTTRISERLAEGDVIGAIELCVTSAKSINVGERPTFSAFLDELFSTQKPIIELPDGANVSPAQAIEWLDNRKE